MKYQSARRKLAVILTVAFMLGLAPFAPQTAYAAMPTSAPGDAWDGVDFNTLIAGGSGIYYGAYKHATSWSTDYRDGANAREHNATPVLWRVMGEEKTGGVGDGYITLMSEYVLDSQQFDTSNNNWDSSFIKNWLNVTFLSDCFYGTESNWITPPATINTKSMPTGQVASATSSKIWLPATNDWDANSGDGDVSWYADLNATPVVQLGTGGTANVANLKGSGAVYWWLRSPDSNNPDGALSVFTSDVVNSVNVNFTLGVRPAFKLNPQSIIFTSEIKVGADTSKGETEADPTKYIATGGSVTKSYKLTVVNSGLTLSNLKSGAAVTGATNFTVPYSGSIALTGTGDGDKLAYKIVGVTGSIRSIVGYGTGAAGNSNVSIAAQDLNGTPLAPGTYTVYVWTQRDNAINSHEGSTPQYFTMTVDASALQVTNITLNPATLNMTVGDPAQQLTPTITPTTATVQDVTWASSNPSVATVDTSGNVTAVGGGTATITVTANDGSGQFATCAVTVSGPTLPAPGTGGSTTPTFTRRTLTDTPTGVKVTAGMDMGTRLNVTANTLHPAGCKACDEIRARQAAGDVVKLYDIALTGSHKGEYEVFIPFSGSGYYTVLHCNKGVLEKQSGLYANGGITTTWAKLSPFAVVSGADIAVPDNVVVDPPKTGDAGSPWGYLMMLAGMIGLAGIVLLRRKWKITE